MDAGGGDGHHRSGWEYNTVSVFDILKNQGTMIFFHSLGAPGVRCPLQASFASSLIFLW